MRPTINTRLMAQQQCTVSINIGLIEDQSSLMMTKAILLAMAERTKQALIFPQSKAIVLQILSDVILSCNLATVSIALEN